VHYTEVANFEDFECPLLGGPAVHIEFRFGVGKSHWDRQIDGRHPAQCGCSLSGNAFLKAARRTLVAIDRCGAGGSQLATAGKCLIQPVVFELRQRATLEGVGTGVTGACSKLFLNDPVTHWH
jgi:hypothetical protein